MPVKKSIISILLGISFLFSYSQTSSNLQCITIAQNWMYEHFSTRDSVKNIERLPNELVVVNFMHGGWVLLNAINQGSLIVGFSNSGIYSNDELISNQLSLQQLRVYGKDYTIDSLRYSISAKKFIPLRKRGGVTPFITTKWSQREPYNNLMPIDPKTGIRCYAGCQAIALAQVLNYYKYPDVGESSNSYIPVNNLQIGTLTVNFNESNYHFTQQTDTDIQKLIYDAGVAVDMQYSSVSSGAWLKDVNKALNLNFKFTASKVIYRIHFTDKEWLDTLKNELNHSRPIIYNGDPYWGGGGHSFIFDGYTDNDFFHVNWGWGGKFDGYFSINAIAPGVHDFSSNNLALIGLQPNYTNTKSPDLTFTKSKYSSKNIVIKNSAVRINDVTDTVPKLISAEFELFNNGNDSAKGLIRVSMYVDDSLATDFTTNGLQAQKSITFLKELVLTIGSHTLKAVIDESNTIAELNKTNNVIEQRIVVDTVSNKMDLSFSKTAFMKDSLLVSDNANNYYSDDSIDSGQPFYYKFGICNTGNVAIKNPILNTYIDDSLYHSEVIDSYVYPAIKVYKNNSIILSKPGRHTLKLLLDPNNEIQETSKLNNSISRFFYVYDNIDVAFSTPKNEKDSVIFLDTLGAKTSLDTLYILNKQYFKFGLINNGKTTINDSVFVRAYIDSNLIASKYISSLLLYSNPPFVSDSVAFSIDSPGKHTFTLVIDPQNRLHEINEANNRYTKSCYIIGKLQSSLPKGLKSACSNTTSYYSIPNVDDATSIRWSMYPNEAGKIFGEQFGARVQWSSTYIGDAFVKVALANTYETVISDSLKITIHKNPEKITIASSGTTTFCKGDSVFLSAPQGYSYKWSNGDTLDFQLSIKNEGFYSVTVTDTNGCHSSSDTTKISVLPMQAAPQIRFENNTLSVAVDSSISCKWYRNGFLLQGQLKNTITKPESGMYTVQFDSKTCYESSQFELTNPSTQSHYVESIMLVTPNPTQGQITIQYGLSNRYSISIYDMMGKHIFHQEHCNRQIAVDLSCFGSGLYVCLLVDETNGEKQTTCIDLQ